MAQQGAATRWRSNCHNPWGVHLDERPYDGAQRPQEGELPQRHAHELLQPGAPAVGCRGTQQAIVGEARERVNGHGTCPNLDRQHAECPLLVQDQHGWFV